MTAARANCSPTAKSNFFISHHQKRTKCSFVIPDGPAAAPLLDDRNFRNLSSLKEGGRLEIDQLHWQWIAEIGGSPLRVSQSSQCGPVAGQLHSLRSLLNECLSPGNPNFDVIANSLGAPASRTLSSQCSLARINWSHWPRTNISSHHFVAESHRPGLLP